MEQLNNYIIELRVIQDIKYFLEYVEKNASSFCSYYGITSPRNDVEAQFLASIALAKEKAKLLKPDSAVAAITKAGVTLICGEEEEIFFRDFYRPSLKTSYKVFKSFKELLAESSENLSYKIGRIDGMLYYLDEEGKIISDEVFNIYKEELQKFDSRWYGTDPNKIGDVNIKDMRIKKNLCISFALYHGISLDEVIDIYNNDDLELLN